MVSFCLGTGLALTVPIVEQVQFGSHLSVFNAASRMGGPGAALENQGLVEGHY